VLVALGDRMSSLRTSTVLALTGLYSTAALFISVATSASTPSSPLTIHAPQAVDRGNKGDLLTHLVTPKDAGPLIFVEFLGNADVVIRDRAGSILFAVDNATRATTVAKQSSRNSPAPKEEPSTERQLPDGCEGAFSPYAEPSKARIIGRCMSGIFSQDEVPS
jgi:hypothetical protein